MMRINTLIWGWAFFNGHRFLLTASKNGLCRLMLPCEASLQNLIKWTNRHISDAHFVKDQKQLSVYISQLDEYFDRKRKTFEFDIDLIGTDFQKSVWNALLNIPYGTVKSYSEIARQIGQPTALRAVGNANGANPIPIVVPCHRVIAKNGTLGGYGGGLDMKRKLLFLEGVISEDQKQLI